MSKKCVIIGAIFFVIFILLIGILYYVNKLNSNVPKMIDKGVLESLSTTESMEIFHYGKSDTISFTKTFLNEPIVNVVNNETGSFITLTPIEITKTNFKLLLLSNEEKTLDNIKWVAIDW